MYLLVCGQLTAAALHICYEMSGINEAAMSALQQQDVHASFLQLKVSKLEQLQWCMYYVVFCEREGYAVWQATKTAPREKLHSFFTTPVLSNYLTQVCEMFHLFKYCCIDSDSKLRCLSEIVKDCGTVFKL